MPPIPQDRIKKLQRDFYKTYHIMYEKVNIIGSRITIVNYLGLVLPVVTAGLVAVFYSESWFPKWAIHSILLLGGLLSLLQLSVSLWALTSKWEDKLRKSQRIMAEFIELRARLQNLDPNDEKLLKELESKSLSDGAMADSHIGVSGKEKARAEQLAAEKYP